VAWCYLAALKSLFLLYYLLKRVTWGVATLLVISFCLFGMSKCTPMHPVEQYLDQQYTENSTPTAAQYQQAAALLGHDIPAFYCSLVPRSYPDTLYRVFPISRRAQFEALIDQTTDAQVTARWLDATTAVFQEVSTLPDSVLAPEVKYLFGDLARQQNPKEINLILSNIRKQVADNQLFIQKLLPAETDLNSAIQQASFQRKLPRLVWYGTNNQYHKWLSGLLRSDFGTSYKYRLPVRQILGIRIQRSATLGFFSLVLAFGLALPAAVWMAGRSNKPITESRAARFSLFVYAIPVFWLGSLLILLFATPFAGMKIFRYDCSGASSASLFDWLSESWKCLILPILCLSVHIGAVVYLQMRTSMAEVLQKEYIRTAKLKGLSQSKVLWKHAFPNAVFPIIAMLGGVFAFLVAGSLVIEYLFNIKGMGAELVEAHSFRDYPMLFAILMLYSVALVVGNLVSDLLLAWLDPRVRFSNG
jgi:peptide/nickel transport system permease protein